MAVSSSLRPVTSSRNLARGRFSFARCVPVRLEILPSELAPWGAGPLLKSEPIDVTIKGILFDAYDSDFAELFKVLADFETSVARNQQSVHYYAGFLAPL